MSHLSTILRSGDPSSGAWTPVGSGDAAAVSLGLLRHHTKNALQRILGELARFRELQAVRGGHRVAQTLERRVMLSASLSDALFGLTRAPGATEERLRTVCEATIALMGDEDQMIGLDVVVEGEPPAAVRDTVLRAAHEMVGNAVKHGLHARLIGHVTVRLTGDGAGARLAVEDNGWGFAGPRDGGEGLGLLGALAALHGGTTGLERLAIGSRAWLELPAAGVPGLERAGVDAPGVGMAGVEGAGRA